MTIPKPVQEEIPLLKFGGAMRAGMFTAQLFVELTITPARMTLTAPGKSFSIDRECLVRLDETSILGIFKRGIRFHHRQSGLPQAIIFYPSINRDVFRQSIQVLGWI